MSPLDRPASFVFSLGFEVGMNISISNGKFMLGPEFNLTYFTLDRLLDESSSKYSQSTWKLKPAFGSDFSMRVW